MSATVSSVGRVRDGSESRAPTDTVLAGKRVSADGVDFRVMVSAQGHDVGSGVGSPRSAGFDVMGIAGRRRAANRTGLTPDAI